MSNNKYYGQNLANKFSQSFLACSREDEFKNNTGMLERVVFNTAIDAQLFLANLDTNKNSPTVISTLFTFNNLYKVAKPEMMKKIISDLVLGNLLIYSITDLQPLFQTRRKEYNYVNDYIITELEEEELNWLKINFTYNDMWQTPIPLEGVIVEVDDVKHGGKYALNTGSKAPIVATTYAQADRTTDEAGSVVIKELPIGKVRVYVEPEEGLEEQIKTEMQSLVRTLDGAYNTLLDDMAGYNEDWQENGVLSLYTDAGKGAVDGMGVWLSEQGELFQLETWQNLGDKLSKVTNLAIDHTAVYAKDTYGNLTSSDFWMVQADAAYEEVKSVVKSSNQMIDDVVHHGGEMVDDAVQQGKKMIDGAIQEGKEVLRYSAVISEHLDEIMNLPEYIANNDVNAIENFIDTVVMELDPELANEIKNDPEFHIALALLDDNEAGLTYITYVTLMFEAVPPNFYVYSIGKVGGYLLLEALLMVLLVFLSAGTGTMVRATALLGKLATKSAAVAKVAKNIKKAEQAFNSFVKTIEDFINCAEKLKSIGKKLTKSRNADRKMLGHTNKTVKDKKASTKKESRCLICHHTDHHTPRSMEKKGCVSIYG